MRFICLVLCFSLQAWSCAEIIHRDDTTDAIESPGYPQSYSNNLNVTWQITGPAGYHIIVNFSEFDLEASYDQYLGGFCVYDFVQVENLGERKRFCGNSSYYPNMAPRVGEFFKSQDNVMTIRFVSDYSNPHQRPLRFKAHYFMKEKNACAQMEYDVKHPYEGWDELIYCNHICNNVSGSYYCSCRPGFVLHENQHTCKAMCENQVITSDSGEIQSPDFPKPYSRLTDCDWTIQVREGLSINIMFNSTFDIEDHFNYTECVYDYLLLTYSGSSQKYCGRSVPFNGTLMETNVRQLRLDFHTDNAIENAGFKMSYTTNKIKCLDNRAAPRKGRITSRKRKGFYELDDRIEFVCNKGYNLAGQNVIICQSDGNWDAESPVCEAISCGNPIFLRNITYSTIRLKKSDFTYGDEATVQCNSLYKRTSGAEKWKCSEDGTWKSTSSSNTAVPVCKPICGKKKIPKTAYRGQAAGGKNSKRNEWPWMVFLNLDGYKKINTVGSFCGGALISPQYVLTAAHCLTSLRDWAGLTTEKDPHEITVWIAAHDRTEDYENDTPARSVAVGEVKRHPQYNSSTLENDIGLLRLTETLQMTKQVRPICIPTTQNIQNLLVHGAKGIVTGWGLNSRFDTSEVLQKVVLPVVNHAQCRRGIMKTAREEGFFLPNLVLTNNMFCAGYSQSKPISTCPGDSGGSWMLSQKRRFYSFGIVSKGIEDEHCNHTATYTTFTKIASYVDWIRSNSDVE